LGRNLALVVGDVTPLRPLQVVNAVPAAQNFRESMTEKIVTCTSRDLRVGKDKESCDNRQQLLGKGPTRTGTRSPGRDEVAPIRIQVPTSAGTN
jgi:hypothetical protein